MISSLKRIVKELFKLVVVVSIASLLCKVLHFRKAETEAGLLQIQRLLFSLQNAASSNSIADSPFYKANRSHPVLTSPPSYAIPDRRSMDMIAQSFPKPGLLPCTTLPRKR
nr:hypothetical protein CFP56_22440 [Quercus suber]